jgi:hypothetical protein
MEELKMVYKDKLNDLGLYYKTLQGPYLQHFIFFLTYELAQ